MHEDTNYLWMFCYFCSCTKPLFNDYILIMEGILLVLGVMLLFALIANNRFRMLRKMADQVFDAYQQEAKTKYQALHSLLNDAAARTTMQLNENDSNALNKWLQDVSNPGLTIDQQVELENNISKLERQLVDLPAEDREQTNNAEDSESLYRHARYQCEALKKQYNDTVVHYNNAVFLFPSNVFALIFGHKKRTAFWTE